MINVELRPTLKKIQAVLDMKSPRTIKEVQRLTGCLAALVYVVAGFEVFKVILEEFLA